MRIIRSQTDPGLSWGRLEARVSARIPRWLREHIEDKGEFVLLSCGHKENLNSRAVLVLAKISGTYVVCDRCNDLATVVRHMKFREYANIPQKPESDIPLF